MYVMKSIMAKNKTSETKKKKKEKENGKTKVGNVEVKNNFEAKTER